MGHWEATAQAGDDITGYPTWVNDTIAKAFDTGITRLRVEFRSGVENQTDYWTLWKQGKITNSEWRCYRYSTVNDNSDPFTINWPGFQFSELDHKMDTLVVPMMQYYAARGKRLAINLTYVAFVGQISGTGCPAGLDYTHDDDPEEYAEVVEATVRHLQQRYGIVPDFFELLLEPGSPWNGTLLARAGVAAKNRLIGAGFTSIQYIAPSHTDMGNSWIWYDSMMNVSGFPGMISELSYHRYGGVSDSNLAQIKARAQAAGIRSAMLEHIGSGDADLYDDIVKGWAGSWQQFTLAYTGADDGGKYFIIDTTTNTVSLGFRTKFLKQYFKHIEPGAVRVDASSDNQNFLPTAYRNPSGLYTVVVRALTGGSLAISGLPAGRYRVRYTTGAQEYVDGGAFHLSSGQTLNTSIPAAGVLTAFGEPPSSFAVHVTGVTHTQAILSYVAPDANPCSIEVSESPSYAPLVHDVNPSLFAGANSDAGRSLTTGQQRIVVIGKRTSDTGADGKLYSRALATDTVHYVRVTCGAAQGTTHFKTKTIAWGDTSSEPPPFNPDGFGNYAWPSVDWTPAGRNKEYVDPMTGVKLKFMGWPGAGNSARVESVVNADLWWDWQGAWTNAQDIRSGGTAALASTATANAPIFVGIEPAVGGMPFASTGAGGYGHGATVDDVGLRIYGSGTDSNPANRTIQVCLSMDSGQSCYSPAISVTLPQGSPVDNGTFPPNYPTPMYASWGMIPLRQGMDWPRGEGTVDVAGNTVTLTNLSSRTRFLTSWRPGTKIWIAGSAPTCPRNLCTITAVGSHTQLTIQESLNLTGATYKALNFGYRIWKTTSTGAVSVSITKSIAWSNITMQWAGGSRRKCSEVPTTTTVDRDGNPLPAPLKGYLCVVPQNPALDGTPPLWWVGEETGESRMVAIPWHDIATYASGTPNGDKVRAGAASFNGQTVRFDPVDGRAFYAVMETNTSGKWSVFRIRYTGDFREFKPNYPVGGARPTPPLEWTNLSPPSQNRNIEAQIDAYGHPGWDPAKFGYPRTAFSANSGLIVMPANTGGQDGPCWVFAFGLDGNLVKMFNTWDGAPWDGVSESPDLRWLGCHSVDGKSFPSIGSAPGFISLSPPNGGSPNLRSTTRLLGGPFETPVIAVKRSSGWDTTDTSVSSTIGHSSYDSACPSDIPSVWQNHGATGNNCLTVRVGGEPCSNFATANEKLWWPCPWDSNRSTFGGQTIQVGDVVSDARADNTEMLLVVKKTVNAVNDIELVLVRRFDRFEPKSHPFSMVCTDQTHNHGWILRPRAGWCSGGFDYFVPLDSSQPIQERWVFGHADVGVGATTGTIKMAGSGGWKPSQPPLQVLSPRAQEFTGLPGSAFDGVSGASGGLQSYPSLAQLKASGANRYWMLDNHHIEAAGWSRSMNLVSGQSYTYQLGIIGAVDIKRLPIIAWSSHYLLRDISGPGSLISDATPWTYCYAYRAGECRPGSTAGQLFVSAPNITGSSTACAGFDHWADVGGIPCAVSGGHAVSWTFQKLLDGYGGITRRLSLGLTGHNRQVQFYRADASPEGRWVRLPGYWIDGVRTDFLLAKTPSVEPVDSIRRNTFQRVEIKVPAVSGATQAVIDFGYEEFGARTDFYCTTRKERCTVPGLVPFSFTSETISPAPCSSGCTITVPALPQKVLYYRIRWLDGAGNVVLTGPLHARAVD
jgi:hypothetical protein